MSRARAPARRVRALASARTAPALAPARKASALVAPALAVARTAPARTASALAFARTALALAALLLLSFAAGAGLAEAPPAEYFTGVYERVGRDGAVPPGLLNDVVRIDPAPGGLAVSACGAAAGAPLYLLRFDSFGDVQNLLVSQGDEGAALWCLYGNDGDNYPLLTCASDGPGGAKFLLWPEPDAPCGG